MFSRQKKAEDKVQPPAPQPPEPPAPLTKDNPPLSSVIKGLTKPDIQPTKPSKGRGQNQKEPSTPDQNTGEASPFSTPALSITISPSPSIEPPSAPKHG